MKFYLRKFFIVLSIAFGSIFCWLVFISSNDYSSSSTSRNPLPSSASKLLATRTENNVFSSSPSNNDLIATATKTIDGNLDTRPTSNRITKRIRNIVCKINGEYKINCLKIISGTKDQIPSVYIPFSFIRKYFEINGKIVQNSKEEFFEWNHSYSKIFYPDEPYSARGKFLWFGNYNVEFRDRVKCISPTENVPISTQWFTDGHLYPTQISQYGLSHFNKNITFPSSPDDSINLIEHGILSNEQVEHNSILESKKNYLVARNVMFELKSNYTNYLISVFEIKIKDPIASICLTLTHVQNPQQSFRISYSTIDELFELDKTSKNDTVVYGVGSNRWQQGWFTMKRDLLVDLFKANLIVDRKRNNYYLSRVQINGTIYMRNFRLQTMAHGDFAIAAGDWLVRNQNHHGGWEIKVKRKLAKGQLTIKEGWHSAMAQGQAISLLTRLYHTTGQHKYLDSAIKALKLFEIESYKNGVKAIMFDKYNWYEEYPTVPSIFVLNGFIYSLFGLYDLSKSCHNNPQVSTLSPILKNGCEKAALLFDDGIRSLEAALPLFDSGSGSFYDLRHLSLGISPNLARWDYHSTHINQLLNLYTIVRNDLFQTTAQRWIAYMKGHRASHN